MKTPSWQEIGIPRILVDHIKQLKPGFALDALVYQVVMHGTKKLSLMYNCDECGHVHIPARSTEETNHCPVATTSGCGAFSL